MRFCCIVSLQCVLIKPDGYYESSNITGSKQAFSIWQQAAHFNLIAVQVGRRVCLVKALKALL